DPVAQPAADEGSYAGRDGVSAEGTEHADERVGQPVHLLPEHERYGARDNRSGVDVVGETGEDGVAPSFGAAHYGDRIGPCHVRASCQSGWWRATYILSI